MPKNEKGFYEFDVVEQQFIPNKENPKRIKLRVKAEVDTTGDGSLEEIEKGFRFAPKQVRTGSFEKHVVSWIEEIEADHCECPDLEGERIENSGYDFTGTERDYPEKPV